VRVHVDTQTCLPALARVRLEFINSTNLSRGAIFVVTTRREVELVIFESLLKSFSMRVVPKLTSKLDLLFLIFGNLWCVLQDHTHTQCLCIFCYTRNVVSGPWNLEKGAPRPQLDWLLYRPESFDLN